MKNGEEEEKRELRVGSNTAGGTQRREVLLSGRGPLSSLSRWWQVSVAALAAEDGRHLAQGTPLFLSIASRTRGEATAGRRVPSTSEKSVPAGGGGRRPGRCATRPPGATPPSRSDATATRYAVPGAGKRAREPLPFRSFVGTRPRSAGNPRREPFRATVEPCLLRLVECARYLGFCWTHACSRRSDLSNKTTDLCVT